MLSRSSCLAVALAVLAIPAIGQTQLVIPNGYGAVEGNAGNTFPWGNTSTSTHIQWIYDSSHFTLQGVTYPIVISGMKFRADAATATTTWAGGSWPNVVIDVGTSAVDYAAATTTFANNRGTMTNVLTGQVTVLPGAGNGTGIPGPWYIDIPFASSVTYDPNSGVDLIVDVLKDGAGWSGATRSADHVSGTTGAGGPALSSRVYLTGTSALTGLTGTFSNNYGAVIEFSYVPASGLYAGFSATPTTGASPLQVQFTDTTFTSDPGGVLTWAWDVDNDTVVDYTVQNPLHTYTACGTYSVSLTVTDASNPSSTELQTNLIVVDPISAAFSATPTVGVVPLVVQFTDASTGTVTGWAWDFDNDTVVDSTLQNPTWVYGVAGTYSVSLTATNACRSSSSTRTNYITVVGATSNTQSPDVLEFQFNEVRGQTVANTASTTLMPPLAQVNTPNWQGNPGRPYFKANEPGFGMLAYNGRVSNTSLVNTQAPLSLSGSMTIAWWQRMQAVPTSTAYVFGGTGTAGLRIFTGGVAGTSLWYRGSTVGDVTATSSVQASPGVWMHVALVIDDVAGTGTWYFDGVADPVRTLTASHSLAITECHVGYHTSTTSTTIYPGSYDLDDFRLYGRALSAAEIAAAMLSENPTSGQFGTGCPGPNGIPSIGAIGAPQVGNLTYGLTLTQAEDARLAALVMGMTPFASGVFDLSALLGPGCALQTTWGNALFYVTLGGAAVNSFGLPNNPAFKGSHVYAQWLVAGTTGAATPVLDINIE